jgi:hypothetical protein
MTWGLKLPSSLPYLIETGVRCEFLADTTGRANFGLLHPNYKELNSYSPFFLDG